MGTIQASEANAVITPTPDDEWKPLHPLDTEEEDGGWLPTFAQVQMAISGNVDDAIGPDASGVPFHRGLHSSMRQGFGLVGLVALIASLPAIVAVWWGPFANFGIFTPVGGIVNLLTGYWRTIVDLALFANDEATVESVMGGAPWLWALGAWLGAPVRLWTLWLVGGLLVFAIARMIGARNTLPRFYAATAYAFLPLLLLVLLPIPIVGVIALVVGLVLFFVLFAQGVKVATAMDWGHVLIALLAPLAIYFLLGAVLPTAMLLWF